MSGLLETADLPPPPPQRWLSAPEGGAPRAGAGTDLFADPGGA